MARFPEAWLAPFAGVCLGVSLLMGARTAVEPRPLRIGAVGPAGVLLFIYHPDDCAAFRPIVDRLNEAYRRGLDVRGIPVRKPEGRAYAGGEVAARPAFPDAPQLVAPAVRVLIRLGYRRSPLVVGVDGRGRVRHVLDLEVPAVVNRRALARLDGLLTQWEDAP